MASELRRRKGQIRNRLSLHLTGVHEIAQNIPAISELRNVVKKGRLLKLSSRGILYPDAWKKRTCVLTKHKLYIYKTEEQGGRERALAEIDLGVFSHCEETNSKESKKVANSFGLYQKGAEHQELGRHLFAAETLTEMSEWVKKIRTSIQAVATESRRRKSCTPSRDDAQVESRSAGDLVFPESGAGPQLPGLTRERVRGPPRRRPSPRSMLETSRSQPSLNEDTDQDQDPARRIQLVRERGLAYTYSSSEDSVSSVGSSRCSVIRRLNTTMPEIVVPPDRQSASQAPLAVAAVTSASTSRQQGGVAATPPCLARRKRSGSSVPSLVNPLQQLEREFSSLKSGGGSSTGSSSLSNLTATLTREGQALPVLTAGLEKATSTLKELSSRLSIVENRTNAAESDITVTRADISAIQDNVTSLQNVVGSVSNKMALFSGMFHKVDEQLQDMWTEMDTVNNNVHHVLHKALEYQRQNERLFSQLEELRNQLIAAFPDRLHAAAAPKASRITFADQLSQGRSRRERKESEQLCQIDEPGAEEEKQPVVTSPPAVTSQVTTVASSAPPQGKPHELTAVDDPLSQTMII